MAAQSNVYITNLPAACSQTTLQQLFGGYGPILSLRVKPTLTGRSYGFVQYASPASAATAIAAMNGALVEGQALQVKLADRNAGEKTVGPTAGLFGSMAMPMLGGGVSAPRPSNNLYVGNLPVDWSEAEVNTVCGTYGHVVSSRILKDKNGGHRGAALVRYADIATGKAAQQALNGLVLGGGMPPLQVKFADRPEDKAMKALGKGMPGLASQRFQPYDLSGASAGYPGAMAPLQSPAVGPMSGVMFGQPAAFKVPKRTDITPEEGSNLYIFGLDPSVTELHLYEAFAGYGAIRSVRVVTDKATGRRKGFAFVQYFNAQDAQSAMLALNGLPVGSKAWTISVQTKKA